MSATVIAPATSRWRLAAWWPMAGLAGLAVLPWLVDGYTLYSLARILAIGLLAVSVAVLTGTAGLPTLGQVAPYAVGAYTAGLAAKHGLSTTGPLLLAAATVAGATFAFVVGLAVVRTRAVVCLMVTLAVAVLTATAADQWRGVTGGGDGLTGIPTPYAWPGGPRLIDDTTLYWFTLAVAAAAVAATAGLLRSRAGMLLRGVRDNETRMRSSGHPVGGYLLAAHTAAGALAGLGGGLLVTIQRFISPSDVGFQVGALVLLAVVVGGAHSIWGALAAAALVVSVRDWAAATVPGHGPLVLGLLFIVAVFVLPHGVAGAWPPGRQQAPRHGPAPTTTGAGGPMTTLLTLRGLVCRFGSLTALDGMDLNLPQGQRHAVIGPNGAGKTTLINVVAGMVRPQRGRVVLAGRDLTTTSPARRARAGIARTFQTPAITDTLTTIENLTLGAWRHVSRRGRATTAAARAHEQADTLGLNHLATVPAGQLAHGQRRLLEIGMALAAAPRLLLLDEPAAGLTAADLPVLLDALRRLPARVSVLLVEHHMDVVSAIADQVTVLHHGQVLTHGTPDQIHADPTVAEVYLGYANAGASGERSVRR